MYRVAVVIPRISLRQALADPALLGGVLEGESWKPWRTLLIAAMGEDLTQDERPVFKKFTGRDREPGRRVEEFVGINSDRARSQDLVPCKRRRSVHCLLSSRLKYQVHDYRAVCAVSRH
jgi:hypothetical protein